MDAAQTLGNQFNQILELCQFSQIRGPLSATEALCYGILGRSALRQKVFPSSFQNVHCKRVLLSVSTESAVSAGFGWMRFTRQGSNGFEGKLTLNFDEQMTLCETNKIRRRSTCFWSALAAGIDGLAVCQPKRLSVFVTFRKFPTVHTDIIRRH